MLGGILGIRKRRISDQAYQVATTHSRRTGTRDPGVCNRFFAIGEMPKKGRIRLNAATDDE